MINTRNGSSKDKDISDSQNNSKGKKVIMINDMSSENEILLNQQPQILQHNHQQPVKDQQSNSGAKVTLAVQELHPHQLLSVHRRSICLMEASGGAGSPLANGSNDGPIEHKKSMVEEMLGKYIVLK